MTQAWREGRYALLYKQGFVPVAVAARLSGHHFTTIYKALKRGTLDGTTYGKNNFVRLTSLEQYVPVGAIRQIVQRAKTDLEGALAEADALHASLLAADLDNLPPVKG